jgi:hypothetical protein
MAEFEPLFECFKNLISDGNLGFVCLVDNRRA